MLPEVLPLRGRKDSGLNCDSNQFGTIREIYRLDDHDAQFTFRQTLKDSSSMRIATGRRIDHEMYVFAEWILAWKRHSEQRGSAKSLTDAQ